MSASTSIEWTDRSWNPTRGCSRVSAGCDHCYAMGQARRQDRPGAPYEGLTRIGKNGVDWSGVVRLAPSVLGDPLRWHEPQKVFVNSMSDLFHEALPFDAIAAVFGIMAAAQRHTFQLLTKRPERMLQWFRDTPSVNHLGLAQACAAIHLPGSDVADKIMRVVHEDGLAWPLQNVWLGVSVEDQETADQRIPLLLQTPASVRFVSYEPALGEVDFSGWTWGRAADCAECPKDADCECHFHTRKENGEAAIDWVIVGGESGPHARPFWIRWAQDTIRQCRDAGVACFVKQLGAWPMVPGPGFIGDIRLRFLDRKGGDPSEWPEDLRVREFPR